MEDITGYPSILGGRVKTLHPKVFGGILARRENRHTDIQTGPRTVTGAKKQTHRHTNWVKNSDRYRETDTKIYKQCQEQ